MGSTLQMPASLWPAKALAIWLGCIGCALAQKQGDPAGPIQALLQRAERSVEASDFVVAEAALVEAQRQVRSSGRKLDRLSLEIVHRLGSLHFQMGEYESAATEMTEAVEIAQALYGEQDEEYLASLSNLAALEHARGNYPAALRHSLAVARTIKGQRGDWHLSYAAALNNLAGVYQSLGDLPRCIANLQQVLAIRKQNLAGDDADTLTARNNLAGVLLLAGQELEAERLLAEVTAARRKSLGPDHPDYAASLNNLAAAEEALGKLAQAEGNYREALRIREAVLGPEHPTVAGSLTNLAVLLRKRGQPKEAEGLLVRALEIRHRALGRWNPDFAISLNNLAVHHREGRDYRQAARWYRLSLEAQQQFIEATLPALPEQQQITLLQAWRRTLDGFLSVAQQAGAGPDEVYGHVLWWKGRVQTRQLRSRRLAAETGDQRLAQLRTVSAQLAAKTRTAAASGKPDDERQIQALVEQREQLESELGLIASGYAAPRAVSPSDLAAALPEDVVLVDFLEYYCSAPAEAVVQTTFQPRTEITAFIVRPKHEVIRLNLGPAAAMRGLIDVWLRTCGAPGQGAGAGSELRERLWLPLAKHVEKSPVVLVSPDGCLTRLPLAALPGRKPETYLLEERAFVVVAVPQLLPELLARPLPQREGASLLLVGDIDYGIPRAKAANDSPRSPALQFEPLAAARSEILAVRDSFERAWPTAAAVTVLRQRQASEARFRQDCSRHRVIHVVTHGFVADSATAPLAPGLSAGLALAGANESANDPLDDGIVTATELANLDLRSAELVVLSACESSLGPIAAGEGVLGLQRACQMAGARTVVASLWKVDDRATQQLMEAYYERLCSTSDPISAGEALRQAQLTMLRGDAARGLRLTGQGAAKGPRRLPPAQWAAFVLSGDWR